MKLVLALLLLATPVVAQEHKAPDVLLFTRFVREPNTPRGQRAWVEMIPSWNEEQKVIACFWWDSQNRLNANCHLGMVYRRPGTYIETLFVVDDHDYTTRIDVEVTINRKSGSLRILPPGE